MNKYIQTPVMCRDSDGDIEHGPREVISGPGQFPGVLCCSSVRGLWRLFHILASNYNLHTAHWSEIDRSA